MQTQFYEVEVKPAPVTGPAEHGYWPERRNELRAHLWQHPPPGLGAEEVEAHFATMPPHYWERVTEEDLLWGLETVHGFFKILNTPNLPATNPIISWRQVPASAQTQVMLCTWDRHGLLAKAAAAFSAVCLDIHQAEVFTRADNVVLDLFHVSDAEGRSTARSERLQEMSFLLEGALSDPPRFASVWACSRHKLLASPDLFPPRISFDNQAAADSTLVRMEASDRLGLLYDILQALADARLNVTQAHIETQAAVARDSIYVKDARGQKVLDPRHLETLRRKLESALTVNPS